MSEDKALIVMYAHPDVWIEDANKGVVCEFPSRREGDFEDRKLLAYQVRDAILFQPPPGFGGGTQEAK